MKRHSRLDNAEIGTDMAAVGRQFLHQIRAKLLTQVFKLLNAKPLDVFGRMDGFKINFHNYKQYIDLHYKFNTIAVEMFYHFRC